MLLLILSDRITNKGPAALVGLAGTAACMVLTYNIVSLLGILDNKPPRTSRQRTGDTPGPATGLTPGDGQR